MEKCCGTKKKKIRKRSQRCNEYLKISSASRTVHTMKYAHIRQENHAFLFAFNPQLQNQINFFLRRCYTNAIKQKKDCI